jgi:hypothetical protein
MVICTEYRGQRYAMGSSDPLPAGFEIQFGSLNFKDTRNGYLMRITNRDELRAQRATRPELVPITPAVGVSASAQANVVGPSAPQRRRRSGQRSRQVRTERRRAACVASQRDTITGETAAASIGEHMVSGPRFPLSLCGATTAYVASTSTDATMRIGRPSHHVLVVRNLSSAADDELSRSSASELPPATSHGYTEWDFSGMLDPVMFRRFLNAADYWFGYCDDPSVGSYDPARECFVVVADDRANNANAGVGDEEALRHPKTGPLQGMGPSTPPVSPAGGADINT